MTQATQDVTEMASRDSLSLRDAAFSIGIERAFRAIKLRGFV